MRTSDRLRSPGAHRGAAALLCLAVLAGPPACGPSKNHASQPARDARLPQEDQAATGPAKAEARPLRVAWVERGPHAWSENEIRDSLFFYRGDRITLRGEGARWRVAESPLASPRRPPWLAAVFQVDGYPSAGQWKTLVQSATAWPAPVPPAARKSRSPFPKPLPGDDEPKVWWILCWASTTGWPMWSKDTGPGGEDEVPRNRRRIGAGNTCEIWGFAKAPDSSSLPPRSILLDTELDLAVKKRLGRLENEARTREATEVKPVEIPLRRPAKAPEKPTPGPKVSKPASPPDVERPARKPPPAAAAASAEGRPVRRTAEDLRPPWKLLSHYRYFPRSHFEGECAKPDNLEALLTGYWEHFKKVLALLQCTTAKADPKIPDALQSYLTSKVAQRLPSRDEATFTFEVEGCLGTHGAKKGPDRDQIGRLAHTLRVLSYTLAEVVFVELQRCLSERDLDPARKPWTPDFGKLDVRVCVDWTAEGTDEHELDACYPAREDDPGRAGGEAGTQEPAKEEKNGDKPATAEDTPPAAANDITPASSGVVPAAAGDEDPKAPESE